MPLGPIDLGGFVDWLVDPIRDQTEDFFGIDDARDRANREKAARDKLNAANKENAETQYGITQEELAAREEQIGFQYQQAQDAAGLARQEISNALQTAEQSYLANRDQLERSRRQARMDVIRSSRTARTASAAGGARGGSVTGQIERTAQRYADDIEYQNTMAADDLKRQISSRRNQAAISQSRIDEQLQNATFTRDSLLNQIDRNRRSAEAEYKAALAGFDYNYTISGINLEAFNDATQFAWIMSAAQGIQAGIQLSQSIHGISSGLGAGGSQSLTAGPEFGRW